VVVLHDSLGSIAIFLLNSFEASLVMFDRIVSVKKRNSSDIFGLEMQVSPPEFKGRSTAFLPE
jgi:hypothetical protein